METRASVEHICLHSGLEEDSSQERVTNCQFVKHGRLPRRATRFTVFNEHYMSVETACRGKEPRGYEFDLSFLASQPKRVQKIDWLSGAVALTLLSAAVTLSLLTDSGTGAMALALLLGGFMLSLGLAFYRSRTETVFVTKHGRLPLLVLSGRQSASAGLQHFLSETTRRIQSTRRNWASKSEFLSAELRQHRQLLEAGTLSVKEYEVIKQRILAKHR